MLLVPILMMACGNGEEEREAAPSRNDGTSNGARSSPTLVGEWAADAGALHRFGPGRRTITLSIPCRYVHTVVETVHRKDLDAAVDLLTAWLQGDRSRRKKS